MMKWIRTCADSIWSISVALGLFVVTSIYLFSSSEPPARVQAAAVYLGYAVAVHASLWVLVKSLRAGFAVRSRIASMAVALLCSAIISLPMIAHAHPLTCGVRLTGECAAQTAEFTAALFGFALGVFSILIIAIGRRTTTKPVQQRRF